MDNHADVLIEVQDHHFGGVEGLKSIINDYYENEIGRLNASEQKTARLFLEEGLIVSGRRVGITEGVEKERYNVDQPLLEKLLDSRLIRIENTHLGKSYEISHDTLLPPIMASYEKRIEKKRKQRSRLIALAGFALFFLAFLIGLFLYQRSLRIQKVADADFLIIKAYENEKKNPSIALKLAQASVDILPENVNSKRLINDLVNTQPPIFYSNEMWIGDYVSSLDFFPDNENFVSAAWDGTLRKWTKNGELIFNIEAHDEAIQSLDVSKDGQFIITGSVDNTAKLWDANGQLVRTIGKHITDVQSVQFTPDNTHVITGTWDGKLRMWDLEGKLVHDLIGHTDVVSDVDVTADGQFMVSVSWDKQIIIWNLKTGKIDHKIEEQDFGMNAVKISPNAKLIAAAIWDGKVKIWEIGGKEISKIDLLGSFANQVSFSKHSNSLFIAQSDHLIREIDFNGKEIRSLRNHTDQVKSIGISNDGEYLVSGGIDYKITVWPLKGVELGNAIAPVKVVSMAIFPDSTKFLVGGKDSIAYIIDETGKTLKQLKGHRDNINGVVISPDGTRLATCGDDGYIILWDKNGDLLLKMDTLTKSDINTIIFSPDGQHLLAGTANFNIYKIDLKGNNLTSYKGHGNQILRLVFAPDGKSFISTSKDGKTKLWNVDGDLIHDYKAHDQEIYAADFSSDGNLFLTGSHDKTIKLWNREGKTLVTLKGHTGPIYSVIFSNDGQSIISTSADGTVKIWDMEGRELQTYPGHKRPVAVAIQDKSEKYIWSADITGGIRKWMIWYTFLESDRLVKLDEAKKIEYGIIKKIATDSINEEKIAAIHHQSGTPYYSVTRTEQMAYFTQSALSIAHPTKTIINKRELAKGYGKKAFHSTQQKEKSYYQKKCTKYMREIIENWSIKGSPSGGIENVIIFSYADESLWTLMENKPREAYNTAQKGLKYEKGWSKVKNFLKARLALASFYSRDYEAGITGLDSLKNIKLYNAEKLGRDFSIPYDMNHGHYPDTSFYMSDLILQDIDLLEKQGVTNAEVPALRKLLSTKAVKKEE